MRGITKSHLLLSGLVLALSGIIFLGAYNVFQDDGGDFFSAVTVGVLILTLPLLGYEFGRDGGSRLNISMLVGYIFIQWAVVAAFKSGPILEPTQANFFYGVAAMLLLIGLGLLLCIPFMKRHDKNVKGACW